MERIPFAEAIGDKNLLKGSFDDFSLPQKVTLKAFYGLPLSHTIKSEITGYSEMDLWAILQGSCDMDYLGYPTTIRQIPYKPKEYNDLWAVIGRRSGKTSKLQSFIIAYEALLGGHEEYIAKGQECVIYLIAQKLEVAEMNMPFIRDIIHESPILGDQIVKDIQGYIKLKNGISIKPSPPSIKAQRGLAVPVAAMDEVAFWYKDADSANPDFEVERAVAKAQLQFPNRKKVGISTPWSKEGLLWKYNRAGTEGCKLPSDQRREYRGKLVCVSTTAAFENPVLIEAGGRERLEEEFVEDKESFERECLCVFPDSVSGFLNRQLVEMAFDKGNGVGERAPVVAGDNNKVIPTYVAAIDPAFRQDSFALCILHRDVAKGLVVDVLRRWTPIKGTKLNPREILQEITQLAVAYDINVVFTDQYQLESLQQLALDMGISLIGIDFTAKSKSKIYGSLQQVVNQGKLELLDMNISQAAKDAFNELITLERRQMPMGGIQIGAPQGKHDDMAAVIALAARQAIWMEPTVVKEQTTVNKVKTAFEQVQEHLLNKQRKLSEDF